MAPIPAADRTPNAALRGARERNHWSQDDLVRALREAGWSSAEKRSIQRYESGEVTKPQGQARRALIAVFNARCRNSDSPDTNPRVAATHQPPRVRRFRGRRG